MNYSSPAPPTRVPSSPLPPAADPVPTVGMTIFGCDRDEADLFREMAPRFGIRPTITEVPASPGNLGPARGNRFISVGHKTRIADSTLLALSRAGVTHISTRSIGSNHLDVRYAESVGISVSTVSYSPDSVADYTLMLILMSLRNAKAMIRNADAHDYRLPDARGKDLRDLTVGVIGAGRIGTAVIERLRGFGCRILAYDRSAAPAAERVSLGELIRASDVVTLHTPLTADTHHLLDRRRIDQLKHGAHVINTGRGSLLDTDALVRALEEGRLGGAALDVIEGEEGIFYEDCRGTAIDNTLLLRLQESPSVLISPHSAYYTDRTLRDMVENTIADCLSFETERRHC